MTRDDLANSRISLGQVVQVIVYVITIMLAYSALDRRITTVEVKYELVLEDLHEIKGDVKTLIGRKP